MSVTSNGSSRPLVRAVEDALAFPFWIALLPGSRSRGRRSSRPAENASLTASLWQPGRGPFVGAGVVEVGAPGDAAAGAWLGTRRAIRKLFRSSP